MLPPGVSAPARGEDAMVDRATRNLSEAEARGLEPGAEHYMAYVGPADEYDLMSATQFRLLTTLGLRRFHRLLDFILDLSIFSHCGLNLVERALAGFAQALARGGLALATIIHPGPNTAEFDGSGWVY